MMGFDNVDFNKEFYFPMAVIFNKPTDFPDKVVIRIFDINPKKGKAFGTEFYELSDSLEDARGKIPSYFTECFPRDENEDDPNIVETWM
jgi:hypothetical protein